MKKQYSTKNNLRINPPDGSEQLEIVLPSPKK